MKKRKTDFKPFKVGTVFNQLILKRNNSSPKGNEITIKYPSRLEAMALDPSKIADNNNLKYSAGQINFTVGIYKTVTARIISESDDIISNDTKRTPLVKHSIELMRKAIGFKENIYINVKEELSLRHCGLGSSSGLIASVACAINELYGKPISDKLMIRYLAQNHGEEIDGTDDYIKPVQCLGGSAACGTYEGGLFILAGENTVIKTHTLEEEYSVIIGVPKDYKHPDSEYLMEKEIENFDKFMNTGKKYGPTVAYRLIHECFPALEDNDIKPIGDLIYDYRWKMGSIDNCSFVYPPIVEIANKIAFLKEGGHADILSMSSVGPGMFAVTKSPEYCDEVFQKSGLNTYKTHIHNGKYKIINFK